jgi:hypothetical protein
MAPNGSHLASVNSADLHSQYPEGVYSTNKGWSPVAEPSQIECPYCHQKMVRIVGRSEHHHFDRGWRFVRMLPVPLLGNDMEVEVVTTPLTHEGLFCKPCAQVFTVDVQQAKEMSLGS